jgi:hypothetical protein
VKVTFQADWDPYLAFDYVELSLFAAVSRLHLPTPP